ncbi:hypothetical protein HYY69_06050 [Candidatus Woesearchaeota archaeon]|nr:hypothetical protein [Candidatus Woesearchaeota archaeon]
MNWLTRYHGHWQDIDENSFIQKIIKNDIDNESVFHRYTKIDLDSYQLKCKIKIEERGVANNGAPWGEAKILYSDADINEEFRLDFMHVGELKSCRLSFLGFQQHFPLDIAKTEGFDVEFTLRSVKSEKGSSSTSKMMKLSLKVDGFVVFKEIPILKEFNGHVGFGTCLADVKFGGINFGKIPSRKCFVIMPFNDRRDYMYINSIEKALVEIGGFEKPFRLDKSYRLGKIPIELIERIEESDFIIAEISEDNLNVYYEIGYSYALKKAILFILEDGTKKIETDIPFDIRMDRIFKYKLPIRQIELDKSMKELKENIIKFIETNILK